MTPENFVYWLQGYFEINDAAGSGINSVVPGRLDYLRPDQLQVIKDHLKLVLEKKTPTWITAPNLPHTTGVRIDPVYYQHNGPIPLASCLNELQK